MFLCRLDLRRCYLVLCWLCGPALALAAGSSSEPTDAARVWAGQLEVLAQAGPGCAPTSQLPLLVPVHLLMARDADGSERGYVWGAMQAAELRSTSTAEVFSIRMLPFGSLNHGELTLRRSATAIEGTWAESAGRAGKNDCLYTQARLALHPVAAPAAAALQAYAQGAQAIYRRMEDDGRNGAWTPAALQTVLALGARWAGNPLADGALAQAYLDLGEALWLQRRKPEAALLMRLANQLYRVHANTQAEEVALGLDREASLLRSLRRWREAEKLYRDAQQILAQQERANTAAAAIVHNNHASLLLRQRKYQDAMREYARALDIDEARGAGATELAVSMNNLAGTFERLGQIEAAAALYRRALERLGKEGQDGSEMATLIRNQLTALDAHKPGSKGAHGVGI